MPVVVAPDAFDFWLDCRNIDAPTAAALLVPAREGFFEAYEISTAVNRVANDTPAVLEPASEQPEAAASVAAPPAKRQRAPKKDDRQSSLF
jgi:hypothetical protein